MTGPHSDESSRATPFRMAFVLNLVFAVLEVAGGILTRSTAILADAVHDLGDSLSLAVSWWMENRAQRPGDQRYTFGYGRFSLLGGMISAVVLTAGAALVLRQALPRLLAPGNPHGQGMMVLAGAGILVNSLALLPLRRARGMNARMVTWHLLEDVLGWMAVLIGGAVIWLWDATWLDPLLSIAITLVVLQRVVREARRGLRVFLQAVPEDLDPLLLKRALTDLGGVADVHHLHVWSLDGDTHVLTAHLVLERKSSAKEVLTLKKKAQRVLEKFPLTHSTLEIEYPEEACRLAGAPSGEKCHSDDG